MSINMLYFWETENSLSFSSPHPTPYYFENDLNSKNLIQIKHEFFFQNVEMCIFIISTFSQILNIGHYEVWITIEYSLQKSLNAQN